MKNGRTGTITEIVQGIATITFDEGGTVPMHPSAWKGYTGAVGEEFMPPVGTRVRVAAGSVWRA